MIPDIGIADDNYSDVYGVRCSVCGRDGVIAGRDDGPPCASCGCGDSGYEGKALKEAVHGGVYTRYFDVLDLKPHPKPTHFHVWFRAPKWMRKSGRIAVLVEAPSAADAIVLACSSGLYSMIDIEGSAAFVYDSVVPVEY